MNMPDWKFIGYELGHEEDALRELAAAMIPDRRYIITKQEWFDIVDYRYIRSFHAYEQNPPQS